MRNKQMGKISISTKSLVSLMLFLLFVSFASDFKSSLNTLDISHIWSN